MQTPVSTPEQPLSEEQKPSPRVPAFLRNQTWEQFSEGVMQQVQENSKLPVHPSNLK